MANEFYSAASIATFAGATAVTITVTNALRTAFGWDAAWVGFAVAEVVCFTGLVIQGAQGPGDWAVAFFNGCAVYLAAAGASAGGGTVLKRFGNSGGNQGASGGTSSGTAQRAPAAPLIPRRFWGPWL